MQLFHQRHRNLLFLSIIGGVYLPSLKRIIPRKTVHTFLKGYANILMTCFLLLAILSIKNAIFEADNIIDRLTLINNLSEDVLGFSRILFFNMNRKQAQALYDLWDEFFTGDGHDKTREKLIKKLKKPYKRIIIICIGLISFMGLSWGLGQFDNEDCDFSVPIGIPFQKRNPEFFIWATIITILFSVYGPMNGAVDLLIMEPMIWTTAEFMRLKESLAEILNIHVAENGEIIKNINGFSYVIQNKCELERDFKQVDEKINQWIIDHQKVLIFHRKTVALHNVPLLVQLLCTTTSICLFSYLFALNIFPIFDLLMGLLAYIPNYLLFYIISIYGELVKKEAVEVFDNAFAKNWVIYPKHIREKLHIIALRTNYPLTTDIMKIFHLNLKTFFQILKNAYSFYNFFLFITYKAEIVL